jgi:hypothetical protein
MLLKRFRSSRWLLLLLEQSFVYNYIIIYCWIVHRDLYFNTSKSSRLTSRGKAGSCKQPLKVPTHRTRFGNAARFFIFQKQINRSTIENFGGYESRWVWQLKCYKILNKIFQKQICRLLKTTKTITPHCRIASGVWGPLDVAVALFTTAKYGLSRLVYTTLTFQAWTTATFNWVLELSSIINPVLIFILKLNYFHTMDNRWQAFFCNHLVQGS